MFDVEKRQFGHIDGELLAWDFVVVDEEGGQLSSVNRNFSGFAREVKKKGGGGAYTFPFKYLFQDLHRFRAVRCENGGFAGCSQATHL